MKIIKKPLILLISLLLSACLNQNIITTNKFENSNSETQVKNNLLTSNYQINDNKENEITFKDKTYKIGDEIPDELIKNYVFERYKESNEFTYASYFNKVTLENGVEIKKPLDFSNSTIYIGSVKNNKINLDLKVIWRYYDSNDNKYSNLSTTLDSNNNHVDPILNLIFLLDFNDKKFDPILNLISFYYNDKSSIKSDSSFNSKVNSVVLTNYKFVDTAKKLILFNNKFETTDLKIFNFNSNINGDSVNGKLYLSNKIGIQKVEFNLKEENKKEFYNVEFIFNNFLETKDIDNYSYEELDTNCIKNSKMLVQIYKNNFIYPNPNLYTLDLSYFNKIPCELSSLLLDKENIDLRINNYLPEEIFKSKNLKSLSISSFNSEIKIPEVITSKNLEVLNIHPYSRRIEIPSQISNFYKLKELGIYNPDGDVILPKEIVNLKELKKISIESKSKIELDGIYNLKKLESLNIKSNFPLELKGLESLTKLDNLHLSLNNFEKIPNSVVNNTYLKYLDLNHNKITNIPSEISNLINLESINLENNKIQDFSNLLMLPSIKNIYLDYNNITDLPIDELMKIKRNINISLDTSKIPRNQIEKVIKNHYVHLQ